MRVLLDANVYISHLLSKRPTTSALSVILEAASSDQVTLVFSTLVRDEIAKTVATRPDLSHRVNESRLDELVRIVESIAESLSEPAERLPRIGRDRKDDYLIAHAVIGRADYLVTWDNDLLDLSQVADVRVVNPGDFVRLLRDEGLVPE